MGATDEARRAEGSAEDLTHVLRVVPDVTGIDKTFDYVASDPNSDVPIGSIVRVVLNGRRVDAWVVESVPAASQAPDYDLKPIEAVLSVGPDPEVVDLARWAARRFAGPMRSVLRVASPPKRVKRVATNVVGRMVGRGDSEEAVDALVALGGGVVVWPPSRPLRRVVESALRTGRTIIVCPGVAQARGVGLALRREGLSVAIIPDDWQRAAEGVDVVVGARSAVWAPCPGLATIVVVDEHDERHQEERAPTWHVRDVAIERTRRAGAACFLISPLPTVSAIEWAGAQRTVSPAARQGDWPRIVAVDPYSGGSEDDAPTSGLLSSPLIEQIRRPDTVVACILNVKGRARLVACRSCREIARCELCGSAMALDAHLECRACGHVRPVVCTRCGSGSVSLLRKGVARMAEEIRAASGRAVHEVTAEADTPGNREAGVYVGTEALLHRLNGADVVAFLDFDNELFAPTYRAGEHAWTLLVLAARALRGSADPLVILQTADSAGDAIAPFLAPDPVAYLATETETRRRFGFPPFARMARVTGDESLAGVLAAVPLGVDVSSGQRGAWLVRGTDDEAFENFCADLRAARARVHVDPLRY